MLFRSLACTLRQASLSALGEMREAAKPAIPLLREALKDPDGFTAQAARNALFRVEPNAKDEIVAIEDATRPKQVGNLWDDLSTMQSVLPGKVPEAFEVVIYEKYALATTACSDTPDGRCRFKYEGGAVTGPEIGRASCRERVSVVV